MIRDHTVYAHFGFVVTVAELSSMSTVADFYACCLIEQYRGLLIHFG